jgi:hypothetical protein
MGEEEMESPFYGDRTEILKTIPPDDVFLVKIRTGDFVALGEGKTIQEAIIEAVNKTGEYIQSLPE